MHDHRPILVQRVERTLRERIRPAELTVLTQLEVSAHPVGDRGQGEPIGWSEAHAADYRPFAVGSSWGPAWGTTWFRCSAEIPAERADANLELAIDLGWQDHSAGFQCEALVRSASGEILKALNPRNQWVPVRPDPEGGSGSAATVTVFVEAAANPLLLDVPPFQPTLLGDRETRGSEELFTLVRADLVLVNDEVRALIADMDVLFELASNLPENDARGWEILIGLGRAIDRLDLADVPATAAAAREILAPLLQVPAHPGAHRLTAVGHAHIDSAWLWPIRETRRKVARTIANVLRLIDDGSGLVFALPAAQHVAWLAADEPELFERLQAAVAAGGIIPVGGMWVEPDAVLPGGEAMCRQLTEGMAYFEEAFGTSCREIWLPDSFGYSGALPQLAKLAGVDWFLTQKISWNQVDTFPHHTLWWEGIDGTRIFTHFPPVDTYGAEVTGANLTHAVGNFKDKGRTNVSLMPFGYGDGGGGPTREMIERIDRFADLAGAPKVTMESPHDFFERAQAEYADAPVWVGELYLELHRGTFTSQLRTKDGNRRSEALLRAAEHWCTVASVRTGAAYPHAELREVWRATLLCQFHDILPGTSIAWAYREVDALYAEVRDTCERLIATALDALTDHRGQSGQNESHQGRADAMVAYNAGPFPVRHGATTVPALGSAVTEQQTATVELDRGADGAVVVDNGLLRVAFRPSGLIDSLVDLGAGRETVPPEQLLGELHLHQDFPNMWDAWDIDPFYRDSKSVVDDTRLESVEIVADGPDAGAARVVVRAAFGASTATMTWTLPVAEQRLDLQVDLDWHEQEKLLKLALPIDVHTDQAQYETQFGHLIRPTHENTSWDAMRFEVSCHRWLRVADTGWGVALTNRSTYGYDITRHERVGGGTYSVVRPSLAKGARFPDPEQDQGRHRLCFSLLPGADTEQAIADGYRMNLDLHERADGAVLAPLVELSGAVLESVALAPDNTGDVVLRLYQATGARGRARVAADWAADCRGVDLRWADNERGVAVTAAGEQAWELELRPFQVATLRLAVRR